MLCQVHLEPDKSHFAIPNGQTTEKYTLKMPNLNSLPLRRHLFLKCWPLLFSLAPGEEKLPLVSAL